MIVKNETKQYNWTTATIKTTKKLNKTKIENKNEFEYYWDSCKDTLMVLLSFL